MMSLRLWSAGGCFKRAFATARGMAIAVLIGCAVLIGGCQGGGQGGIEQMLSSMQAAYLRQDYDAVCRFLTRATQRQIGLIGHDEPTNCRQDINRRMPAEVLSARDLDTPRLLGLEVDGDRASARVRVGDADPTSVRFAREGGSWKLASLFGTTSRRRLPKRVASGRPATARFALARPGGALDDCAPVKVSAIVVAGGCELYGRGLATFTMVNAFGDRRYTRCPIYLGVHVGGDGTIAVGFMELLISPDPFDLCGDIYACRNGDGETAPWTGRVESLPRRGLRVAFPNMCLDTCIGRFAGRFAFDSARMERGRLVLGARMDGVGESGLSISGTWRLAPDLGDRRLVVRPVRG